MRISTRVGGLVLVLSLLVPMGVAQACEECEEDASASAVQVVDLLGAYRQIQVKLVGDNLDGAQVAGRFLQPLASLWLQENQNHAQAATVKSIGDGAGKLSMAEDLDEARIAFIQVSQGVIELIRADEDLKAKWQLFFCPMVAKKQGYWVQKTGEQLANPYMGQVMPGCGTKKPW